MMLHSNSPNSNIRLLAFLRPGDPLRASLQSFAQQSCHNFSLCSTLYEAMEHLQSIEPEKAIFLVSRPAMLGNASFMMVAKKNSRLRLIGWISEHENPTDKAFSITANAGLMMVSSIKQLDEVLISLERLFVHQTVRETEIEKRPDSEINRDEYRLSHEELDALLGAG